MKIIIIGGVAGGMSAATRLRRLDESAEITVYEQGPHVSFANCGLPYFVGDVIEKQSALLLQTPAALWNRFRINVQVSSRVTAIDPAAQTVTVLNLTSGESATDSYDALVISTGAAPRILDIPGAERALHLRDVPDAVAIKEAVDRLAEQTLTQPSAVILGAGFIGVELAENLRHRGVSVTLVQSQSTVLAQFDPEVIEPFQKTLELNGIDLKLGTRALEIGERTVTLANGDVLPADLVISSVGVSPDHHLAVEAGLRIGQAGGIWVDDQQRTSDPNIYAVGDAAEKVNFATGEAQMIWLANLANRHGRLVADVIAGEKTNARPVLGTGIIGAFGMVAALTGLTEKAAKAQGIPHSIIHLHPSSHAGYYPGAQHVAIKVLFDPATGKLLGAQATGRDGADKRIDVLATAIFAGLTVNDLMDLELAYSPQYGSAKDAINQAGYVGNNVFEGKTPNVQWHEVAKLIESGTQVIDVRTRDEYDVQSIPGSVHIPVDEIRERLDEIRPDNVVVHCRVGQRGHIAAQILRAQGIAARNLDGGCLTWRAGMDSLERKQHVSSSSMP
jgi:NADPH-dependent 2,4-dienoyl-CoA reductase/sulfur reductase-like enzyme/rhodanese-related sulfurtransferase